MKTRTPRSALPIPAMLKRRVSQSPQHTHHGCHTSHRVVSLMRAAPLLPLLLLLLGPHHAAAYNTFQYSGTTFNHLAVDNDTGVLYLGAVNYLFQLSADLTQEVEVITGPVDDSPDCLPFKDKNNCPQAQETPNTNMILVVNGPRHELITCGQVSQGICEKRSLTSVAEVVQRTDDPGETQFVAANDARVTTVAIVGNTVDGRDLLFVGHGPTTKLQSSVPPVTVRQLNLPALFSNEGLGKLVVSDSAGYNNHYVRIFSHADYIYFLLFRRDGKSKSNYNSYVARVCARDVYLYSYVEVQLKCGSDLDKYNLAQAAHLEVRSGDATKLFIVFATGTPSVSVATEETALCSFNLQDIDQRLEKARKLCYTKNGLGESGKEEAKMAYGVTSNCATLPEASPSIYPCGGEHTPSPIASCTALESKPLLEGVPGLSAVAAVEEDGHTIVFLGDLEGNIHKAYVTPTAGDLYGKVTVDSGSPVNPDLILDSSKQHLYVMTASQVTKLPVAECSQFLDCGSCMQARDPFCGWCILQGSCTEKEQCQPARTQDRWLWSYQTAEQCLEVQEVYPANLSITQDTQTLLILTVPRLPSLDDGSEFKCSFDMKYEGPAEVLDTQIFCKAPPPDTIPSTPPGMDHVIMNLAVMFHDVVIASTDFAFYDCSAVMALAVSSPCRSCVSSPWNCHWCVAQYSCTPVDSCPEDGPLIHSSKQENEPLSGPEACPSVQRVEGSQLFPVGISRELDLIGKNLDLLRNHDMAYQCVLEVEGAQLKLNAQVVKASEEEDSYRIHCSTHEYRYSLPIMEYPVNIHLITENGNRIDNKDAVQIVLYNCTVGHADCSRCQASDTKYGCAWCADEEEGRCLYHESCQSLHDGVCPTPVIYSISPQTGVLEGGLKLTITGSNLGQRVHDVAVTVAGLPCVPELDLYTISTRVVCIVSASEEESSGPVEVSVEGREPGVSEQAFTYQNPVLENIHPQRGPIAGGTLLTISGTDLSTGSDITAFVGGLPCIMTTDVEEDHIVCRTSKSLAEGELPVGVFYGKAERKLVDISYQYTEDPVILSAAPSTSFHGGGRPIRVEGTNLDVIESPKIAVLPGTQENGSRRKRRRRGLAAPSEQVPVACRKNSSEVLFCPTPEIPKGLQPLDLIFILDNVRVSFSNVTGEPFGYVPDPTFKPLNKDDPSQPYILKPGNLLDIEGEGLDLGISKEEVVATIGTGVCTVKTLTKNHLYCVPPHEAPQPLEEGALPEFVVRMGNLNFRLGAVNYETEGQSSFPQEAQIGLGVGAAVVVFIVIIIIFMYRRKSKQAMRDYKKVLVQLENLEISVGDQCRKEFTDLMTGMMDLTSDLEGTGIPFLDYKTYIERIFFPGHTGSPLRRNLDVPEPRRQTVEQGLNQLSNLLNNKLFLTKLICTLEDQQTFSQRDRCHVASLLTLALHGKLEYLTEIMTTLLASLAEQYVVKNPKLMLRRTETMVEKLLTNWMSICLYSYLREAAGEPLYLLFRAIKYQVDKGPVDAVTGKAKRTLNDSRLLREDIEYRAMPLTVLVKSGNTTETQRVPARVLDTDTITQVKEKVLDQVYKGMPFSQRPTVNSLDLEWRSGVAGHLTLSDEDLTSVTQNHWKRLNTLSHYKVPDEATVALIPRLHNNTLEANNHSFTSGEKTPMLEDGDEGGLKMWHLVKSTEEPEPPKHRRSSSMRERERAKAIPEIYLTRLLSMKGTLQKFVDDSFQVILGVNRPVPIAVKYFFDFLDDLAAKHGIEEQETVHIWKTHSLLLRFWVLILKNPQMIFDVQVSDNVDAILCVIAQTFIDSCTLSEHKVGRDSPVNKLLYAREIPRYKQMVEKYYADIRQTVPAGYQEMNSSLTELSGNHVTDLNCLVALQELYNYISKYYDQIITDLDEDPTAQKMQLAYRLQQIAALVENKVTDL